MSIGIKILLVLAFGVIVFLAGVELARGSLSCGIQPIPPIGCEVGYCQCDENGRNCRWTFICD